ncbi:MAG: hypothetical protein WAM60_15320 [Candidatus Promineifilaceae bacterium]
MLDHLRQRVVDALSPIHYATLSTYGAADLQATLLPCESKGIQLYILLPSTSDHLPNLLSNSEVVVTSAEWQLRGTAVVLGEPHKLVAVEHDPILQLSLLNRAEAQWSRLIEITPFRLHIRRQNGWGYNETIDID